MNKRGSWIYWVSMSSVFLLILTAFLYLALFNPNGNIMQEVNNPILGLSIDEAVNTFDGSFVLYLLYSMGAGGLHNPPLSSDVPKIEIVVDGEAYNAVVKNGEISVNEGSASGEDIIIRTTKEESVKMMQDKYYVAQSFKEDLSSIELVAGKTKLFSKGYLTLYNEIMGKSITGNVVRIYVG